MAIDPLYARYPFFEAAREAVESVDASLPALVAGDAPAVERGVERVERALLEGTVAPEDPRRWSPREELLSYPVARVLVSLVDAPAAVEKYAAAEAATAHDRFVDDFQAEDEDGLRSTSRRRVGLVEFLREFDLADAVSPETPGDGPRGGPAASPDGPAASPSGPSGGRSARDPDRFWVALGPYLRLADGDWGERWRLVNREVADGRVRVAREELYRLLREAVHERVAEGLPFEVRGRAGDEIADALDAEVASLRELLADRDLRALDIDTVVPALFPPCMTTLLERTRRGADLDPHSRFALTAFLTGIGMDTDEVVELYRDASIDEEDVRYQTEYLRDAGGTQYPPPSCATMQAYGDCWPDERCETISHPMSYYDAALSTADEAELTDWRETDGPSSDDTADDAPPSNDPVEDGPAPDDTADNGLMPDDTADDRPAPESTPPGERPPADDPD